MIHVYTCTVYLFPANKFNEHILHEKGSLYIANKIIKFGYIFKKKGIFVAFKSRSYCYMLLTFVLLFILYCHYSDV